MSDTEVLAMPSRRFWCMERQIDRIRAASDLRSINVGIAVTGKDALENATGRLILELGETTKVKREVIVKGDPNRGATFARLMGK